MTPSSRGDTPVFEQLPLKLGLPLVLSRQRPSWEGL